MAKKITVNDKLINKINSEISKKFSLNDLGEFEQYYKGELFTSPPEFWSELEIAICDYNGRISILVQNAVEEILRNGNSR